MSADRQSPRIEDSAWGRICVAGLGTGKDYKLYPGGGREWDWRETGTRHKPGIQPSDVEGLIQHHCEVVVLTRGRLLALHVCPETRALLAEHDIEVVVEETSLAINAYNRLAADGRKVGGLFHSTC